MVCIFIWSFICSSCGQRFKIAYIWSRSLYTGTYQFICLIRNLVFVKGVLVCGPIIAGVRIGFGIISWI
jgi:hypothetical protein